MKRTFYSSWSLYFAIFVITLFVSVQSVSAATLSLAAGSLNVSAGDLVTVRVLVNSSDEAINTAEGTIQFPTDTLEVLSLDKSSSVFSLWVTDPAFSNQVGTVSFSGGLPSPGYHGNGGDIINVVFHAKKAGTATLSITDASVRANDGLGTDVLQSTTGLQLLIGSAQASAPAPAVSAPVANPISAGKAASSPVALASSKVGASSQSPQFDYDAAAGTLVISVPPQDTGSRIAGYDVNIDDNPAVHLDASAFDAGSYELPLTIPGSHAVTLDILGTAGETTTYPGTFTVPVIGTPSLAPVSAHMDRSEQLVVSGIAPEDNAQVRISIAKDDAQPVVFLVTPEAAGAFSLIGPIVEQGTYTVSAVGISAGGIESVPTPTMHITVSDPAAITLAGVGISLASVLLALLILCAASFILAAIAWYRLYTYHLRRARLVRKIDTEVHQSIVAFKNDLEGHLDALQSIDGKRRINAQEAKLRADMKAKLAALGTYIEQELK